MDKGTGGRWWGIAITVMGVLIVLAALGVLPLDDTRLHAPRSILGVAGGVLAAGGLALVFRGRRLITLALAGIIVAGLTVVGAWAAFFGAAEDFSGGLPFVSHTTNVRLGRVLFGGGALIGLGILFLIGKQLWKDRDADL